MTSGPNTHNSMNALLSDVLTRLRLVERRLTIGQGISARIVGDDSVEVTGAGTVFDPVSIGLDNTLVTDLNDATRTGFYQAAGSATNTPTPGTAVSLEVTRQGTNIKQEAHVVAVWPEAARTYVRIYNGTTWSAWTTLQPISGESPGMRIASGTVNVGSNVNAGTGLTTSITFGTAFTVAPNVWAICDNGRCTCTLPSGTLPTTTGFQVRLDNWSPGNTGSPPNVFWFALGY